MPVGKIFPQQVNKQSEFYISLWGGHFLSLKPKILLVYHSDSIMFTISNRNLCSEGDILFLDSPMG